MTLIVLLFLCLVVPNELGANVINEFERSADPFNAAKEGYTEQRNDFSSLDYQNDADNDYYYDLSDESVITSGPPLFKLSNYTKTVRVGNNVTLKCDIENDGPNILVLWSQGAESQNNLFIGNNLIINDNRLQIGENDHSLTINNVTEADQNVYQCQILPNRINMSVRLVVLSNLQAHIIEGGRNVTGRLITYRQNDQIQVECNVTGSKNSVDFKWFTNGLRLQSNDNLKINGSLLTIEKANLGNNRVYQCLADDGSEQTAHANVSINIQYAPNVTTYRSVINTKNDDNAELYCHYDSSIESHVVWSKNQIPLETDADKQSKYTLLPSINSTSILIVNSVNSQDLGVYECKVENEIGAENVIIKLTYAPEQPKLQNVEHFGESTIAHWHIRSMQPLEENLFYYETKGEKIWFSVSLLDQNNNYNGIWNIKHKLNLAPGEWRIRAKSKNSEGWSSYSTFEHIQFEYLEKISANTTTSSSIISHVTSIASFISNYVKNSFNKV